MKDTPEEINEEVDVKPTAKKAVRKTIRRVRKVASKRDKEDESENGGAEESRSNPESTDVSGDERSEAKTETPRKRVPKSNQRGSRGGGSNEPESGEDKSRMDGRDRKGGERRSGRQRRGSGNAVIRRVAEPVNPKELSKKAWKIYQADIAEEGIALVDDKTGRNLALRSFELARMFLEEETRQKRNAAAVEAEAKSERPRQQFEDETDSAVLPADDSSDSES